MSKETLLFIEHILKSIECIEIFTKDISEEEFAKNEEKQSAVIRQIEIIGEAAKNIDEEFRDKYSEVPWKDMAAMRDKLMHHYFGIDLKIVWKTIQEDIPMLKKEMGKIKKELKNI